MKVRLPTGFAESAAAELQRNGIDGWLLFDLEGRNRVMCELLGMGDGLSRRAFLLLTTHGRPFALAHRIELDAWSAWDGELEAYVGWEELEGALGRLLADCKVVAMEVSERNAVPFVDQVPAGVVQLVESLGVRVVSSAPLITGTYAQWGERGYATHVLAGERIAEIAESAFREAVQAVRDGKRMTEHELSERILAEIAAAGLAEPGTIVGVGPNSASPHYEPTLGHSAVLEAEQVLLIDLWGRVADDPDAVFADQTWMGILGREDPDGFAEAWAAVVSARDGAVEFIAERTAAGQRLTGAEVDLVSREILVGAGYGEHLQHRLGHGLDRALHGFGPNLDSVETREERELIPGIGFSVEPGIYIPGRYGIRSEINVFLRADGPEITTPRVQEEPWRG